MIFQESETVELKAFVVENIKKRNHCFCKLRRWEVVRRRSG